MSAAKAVRIDIPDDAWEADCIGVDGPDRLLTTINVNGLYMHLEAWHVRPDERGDQVCEFDDEAFGLLHTAVGADGSFSTVTIRGREYILIASPYC